MHGLGKQTNRLDAVAGRIDLDVVIEVLKIVLEVGIVHLGCLGQGPRRIRPSMKEPSVDMALLEHLQPGWQWRDWSKSLRQCIP